MITITRDADNKWFFGNDWTAWLAQIVADTGGTATISGSSWAFSDPSIVKEGETPNDDDNGITYLVASGGTNGQTYEITNTVTVVVTSENSVLSVNNITQDRTVTVKLEDM